MTVKKKKDKLFIIWEYYLKCNPSEFKEIWYIKFKLYIINKFQKCINQRISF